MKKVLVLVAALLAAAGGVVAAPVSGDEAMKAANIWAAENAAFGAGSRAVSVFSVCDTNQAKTVLWHQVSMSGGGLLIMAPVTEIEPVVAALQDDPGELPAAHPLRGILTFDLRNRLKFLGLYPEDRPALSAKLGVAGSSVKRRSDQEQTAAEDWGKKQDAKWTRLLGRAASLPKALKAAATVGVVDPIAIQIGIVDGFEKGGRFTHWNQENAAAGGRCYNYYTPNNAPCGCVATAMAAVMQYFAAQGVCKTVEGVPEVVTDEADAPGGDYCTSEGKSLGKLKCIGSPAEEGAEVSYAYDWSIFDSFASLADYRDSSKMTEAHRELLGRVAYNAGIMVNMGWTKVSSGAFSAEVVNGLRDAFGFTAARYVDGIEQEEYPKLIYQQCWAGKPVIMGIAGHEVVAVGYGKDGDGVDRVRVFLGWGGSGDAWYALPYIETSSIPGGPSYLSETVSDVITMMAVDGAGTYPVCGRLLPAGAAEVEVGGEKVQANENGYFAARAAAGAKVNVTCQGCTTSVAVGNEVPEKEVDFRGLTATGELVKRTCKYQSDAKELSAAIPGSFLLPLVNFETAVTTPQAQEAALASDKLIFAYSDPDSLSGLAVFNVIKRLSEENYCDCTNRYVFIALSYNSYSVFQFDPASPVTQADYNGTSYGVFDPAVFVPANRWALTNGRLEYSRQRAYTLDANGEPVATAETEEAIKAVLAGGWEQHLRRLSSVKLTVSGSPDAVGEVSPDWGVHAPIYTNGVYHGYTNGETVAFSASMYTTNEVAGIVWKCAGWKLFENGANTAAVEGTETSGSFVAAADTDYELVWQWSVDKVRVSAKVRVGADGNVRASVEPEDGIWCAKGESATFTVTTETSPVKYVLDDTVWSVSPAGTKYETTVDEEGTAGTLTVTAKDKPVVVTIDPHGSKRIKLTVKGSPGDFGASTPAYGVEYHYDNLHAAALDADTVVDNGISWKCMGWQLTGGATVEEGAGANAAFNLTGTSTLTWRWGIDLAAMAGGDWTNNPASTAVTVLDSLPDSIELGEIEFANVPDGWKATPAVDDEGRLIADLQVDAEAWAAKSDVDLTIKHEGISGEVDCNIAVEGTSFTVSAAADRWADEDAGIVYAIGAWTVTGSANDVLASGTGLDATFTANAGDEVTLVWDWQPVGARITASLNSLVNGSDYSELFSLDKEEVWCDFGEAAEFTVTIDNSPASYKFALKDWLVDGSTAYEKDGLTIRVIAKEADGPVNVTAIFDYGKTYANLSFAADPAECTYGSPNPGYGAYAEAKFMNNQMLAQMDVASYTDVATGDEWELAGWELRDGAGKAYQSGDGSNANFRVTADNSVFVWKWAKKAQEPERGEPVPPLGPGDVSPMTFEVGKLNFNIANAVNGWWYGVYTKTDLADDAEPWVYLKGYDPGNPATNLIFSLDLDYTDRQRFFKIKLTENEPAQP